MTGRGLRKNKGGDREEEKEMEGKLKAGGTLLAAHSFLPEGAHSRHAGESVKTKPPNEWTHSVS